MVEEGRREAREGTSGETLPRTRRTLRGKDSDVGGDERDAHLCKRPAAAEEIVRNLDRVWFSHKAMEAIVYWDLSDAYTWQPKLYGSFLRRDMSPKPSYKVICDLFGREWRTNFDRDAPGGRLSFRGPQGGRPPYRRATIVPLHPQGGFGIMWANEQRQPQDPLRRERL